MATPLTVPVRLPRTCCLSASPLFSVRMLTTRLNSKMLDNLLDHARDLRPSLMRDGLGLTELEFALAMMLELQVVDIQQVHPYPTHLTLRSFLLSLTPLFPPSPLPRVFQVQPFVKQFRLLDADGNARLGRDDLDATTGKSFADLAGALQERMRAPGFREKQMSVGARMGMNVDAEGITTTVP